MKNNANIKVKKNFILSNMIVKIENKGAKTNFSPKNIQKQMILDETKNDCITSTLKMNGSKGILKKLNVIVDNPSEEENNLLDFNNFNNIANSTNNICKYNLSNNNSHSTETSKPLNYSKKSKLKLINDVKLGVKFVLEDSIKLKNKIDGYNKQKLEIISQTRDFYRTKADINSHVYNDEKTENKLLIFKNTIKNKNIIKKNDILSRNPNKLILDKTIKRSVKILSKDLSKLNFRESLTRNPSKSKYFISTDNDNIIFKKNSIKSCDKSFFNVENQDLFQNLKKLSTYFNNNNNYFKVHKNNNEKAKHNHTNDNNYNDTEEVYEN